MICADSKGKLSAVRTVAIALAIALPLFAQAREPVTLQEAHEHVHEQRELTPRHFRGAPSNLVLWGTLTKTNVVRKAGVYVATFPPEIRALNGKLVTLVGYMTAIHGKGPQQQFLLSASPILCTHCEHPELSAIAEVNAKRPQVLSDEPVMMQGMLKLAEDVPNGLVYRLNNAVLVRRK